MSLSAGTAFVDLALGDTGNLDRGIADAATNAAKIFERQFKDSLGRIDFFDNGSIDRQASSAGSAGAAAYSTAFRRGVNNIDYVDNPSAVRQAAVGGAEAGKAFSGGFRLSSGKDGGSIGTDLGLLAGRKAGESFSGSFASIFNGQIPTALVGPLVGAVAAVAPAIGGILVAGIVSVLGLGAIGTALALQIGDNKALKDDVKAFGATIVGEFRNITEPLAKPLGDALYMMGLKAEEIIPKLAPAFAVLADAVNPLAQGLVGMFANIVPELDNVLLTSAPLITSLKTELPGLGRALADFFLMLALTPGKVFALHLAFDILDGTIKALGATLFALGTALDWQREKWDQLSNFFHGTSFYADAFRAIIHQLVDAWSRLVSSFRAFGTEALPYVEKFGKIIGELALSAVLGIVIFGINALAIVIRALSTALQWVVTVGAPAILHFFQGAGLGAQIFREVIHQLLAVWNLLIDAAKFLWPRLEELGGAFVKLWQKIQPLLPYLAKFAEILGAAVLVAIIGVVVGVILTLVGVVYALAYAFQGIAIAITWMITGITAAVNWLRGPFYSTIVAIVAWIAGPFVGAFSGAAQAVIGWFVWLGGQVVNWWNAVYNFFAGTIGGFITQTFPGWFVSGFQAVTGWFSWLGGQIAGWWNAAYSWFVTNVGGFITQTFPGWFVTGFHAVVDWFSWLGGQFLNAWNWLYANVIAPIGNFFTQTIPSWASFLANWVSKEWHNLVTGLKLEWDWVYNNVFVPIKNVITQDIPNAFHQGVAAIGKFWEDLKGIVAKPINFVIKTVLEDGILGAIRWIASKVGIPFDVHVNPIPGFAAGGYTGDGGKYQPAGIVHAGEYVMPQEQVRNPRNFALLEAMRKGLPGYSLGGLVGDIGGFFSGAAGTAFNEVKGLGQKAIDIITNPVGAITDAFNGLIGGIPGSGIAKDLPIAAAKQAVGWVADWVKKTITPHFSQLNPDVAAIQQWLKTTVDALPYVFGAVGPAAYDCSGLVGEVIARLLHLPSYQRYFVTGNASEGAFLQSHGFKQGADPNGLIVGFSDEHTMGVLGGLAFEAANPTDGIHVGGGTSDINSFPYIYSLPLIGTGLPGGGGAAPGGTLGQWIMGAIQATGVPASWAAGLGVLIGRESAGNPNAVNNSDANAAAGHPSIGLAQVIGPTFDAYHQAGTSGSIYDPVANIAAAINYIKSRYGDISRVQQANAGAPPMGYDGGGFLQHNGIGVNTSGVPEPVLTNGQWRDISALASRGASTTTIHVIVHDGEVKGLIEAKLDEHDDELADQIFRGAGA